MAGTSGGPYFKGQMQHPCGHYHPEAVLIAAMEAEEGGTLCVYDCERCEMVYSAVRKDIAPEQLNPLNLDTSVLLAAYRHSERKKLLPA